VRSPRQGLEALVAALRDDGGVVVEVLVDPSRLPDTCEPPGPPQIAADGPRARGREAEYELLLEMILEGALLHYGKPRVVRPADPDLALLLGDQLYALGLSRLAALGDLDATAELADVISLVAQSHSAADRALADAVWQAGAVAVGWGAGAELEAAKALARAHDAGAVRALLRAATARRSQAPAADRAGGVRSPAGGPRDAAGGVRSPAGGPRDAAGGVRSPAAGPRDARLDVDDMVRESFNSGSV